MNQNVHEICTYNFFGEKHSYLNLFDRGKEKFSINHFHCVKIFVCMPSFYTTMEIKINQENHFCKIIRTGNQICRTQFGLKWE